MSVEVAVAIAIRDATWIIRDSGAGWLRSGRLGTAPLKLQVPALLKRPAAKLELQYGVEVRTLIHR